MSEENEAKKRTVMHWDWLQEGRDRFGDDPLRWRFVCPCCGHVAAVQDWRAAGASDGEIGFSCIGRRMQDPGRYGNKAPCDYAGGGLFRLNPVRVQYPDGNVVEMFEFAAVADGAADAAEATGAG